MELPNLFSEKQQFRQLWLWALLALALGTILFQILQSAFAPHPTAEEQINPIDFIIPGIVILLVIALFLLIRLETFIRPDGIYYRFFPLHLKYQNIEWDRISHCFVRKYKPILEYGGWGFRMGLGGKGGALNISGNVGLQIVYDNGRRLLLGTRKRDEIEAVLRKMGKLTTT